MTNFNLYLFKFKDLISHIDEYFPHTISQPDIYAIWDQKWFVKIYVIFYKLLSHDIFYYFLKSDLVRIKKKTILKSSQFFKE